MRSSRKNNKALAMMGFSSTGFVSHQVKQSLIMQPCQVA